jgi:hypothetical protein
MTRQIAIAGAVMAVALAMLAVPGAAFGQEETSTSEVALAAEPDDGTTSAEGSETVTPAEPADTTDTTEPTDPVDPVEPAEPAEPVVEAEETSTDDSTEPTESTPPVRDSGTQAQRTEYQDANAVTCLAKGGQGSDNPQVHDDLRDQGCSVDVESGDTVDGITFTFTFEDTPNGEVVRFTTDQPFTGTILVKGGKFHFSCEFRDPVMQGTCHAPVNPNTDRFHDISHVDVCVEEFPDIPPPPPDGDRDGDGDVGEEEGVGVTPPGGVARAEAPGEELPFTGLDSHWLLLLGGALLGCGAFLRIRAD